MNGWISVKDGMPDGECIAISMVKYHGTYREMIIGYVGEDDESTTGFVADSGDEILYDVTHWMPLPEPPEEATT